MKNHIFLPGMKFIFISGPYDSGQSNIIKLLLGKFGSLMKEIKDLADLTPENKDKILIMETGFHDSVRFSEMAKKQKAKAMPVYIWSKRKDRRKRLQAENKDYSKESIDLLLKSGRSPSTPAKFSKEILEKIVEIENPHHMTDSIIAEVLENEIRRSFIPSISRIKAQEKVENHFVSPCSGFSYERAENGVGYETRAERMLK